MKIDYNALAEEWSEAYRADYLGRHISIQIIRALLEFGFTQSEARIVYFSKNIRWFFDENNDRASVTKTFKLFTEYLVKNYGHIQQMFADEFNNQLPKDYKHLKTQKRDEESVKEEIKVKTWNEFCNSHLQYNNGICPIDERLYKQILRSAFLKAAEIASTEIKLPKEDAPRENKTRFAVAQQILKQAKELE